MSCGHLTRTCVYPELLGTHYLQTMLVAHLLPTVVCVVIHQINHSVCVEVFSLVSGVGCIFVVIVAAPQQILSCFIHKAYMFDWC